MTSFSLTKDQEAAIQAIYAFLVNPNQQRFVLAGGSGTGKTAVTDVMLQGIPKHIEMFQLLHPHAEVPDFDIALTATTNKAADVLGAVLRRTVGTVFNFLGLQVQQDRGTGNTSLVQVSISYGDSDLLIVDEASYIDSALDRYIGLFLQHSKRNKVIYIGDPDQLLAVGATTSPVFSRGYPTATLSEIVRQKSGNPIITVSQSFRRAVQSGVFEPINIDGQHIQSLNADQMRAKILEVFQDASQSSCVLAWRNRTVTQYNQFITHNLLGRDHFAVGDQVSVNEHLPGDPPLKNNQIVTITNSKLNQVRHGIDGHFYEVNGTRTVFCPHDLAAKRNLLTEAREQRDWELINELTEDWADLRPSYASTVNKAQGSTFDNVFIDLGDLGMCRDHGQLARMLYVAVSRARHNVYLYGDIA